MTDAIERELDEDDPLDPEPDVRTDPYIPLPDDPQPEEVEA